MNSYNINLHIPEKCFEITQNTWNRNDTTILLYGKIFSASGKWGRIAFTAYGPKGDIVFNNYDATVQWQTRMIIKAGGKVGIGTIDPQKNLNIVSKSSSEIYADATIRLDNFEYSGIVSGNLPPPNSHAIWDIENHMGNLYFNYGFSPTTDLPTPSAKITFTSDGNVGIGTVNPSELLQLGDRFVFHNGGTKVLGYNWDYDVATSSSKYLVDGYSSQIRFSQYGTMSFVVSPSGNAGQEISTEHYALNIDNDGNVGIGTINSQNKLDVCGTIRSKEWIVETGWCDYVFDNNYKRMT